MKRTSSSRETIPWFGDCAGCSHALDHNPFHPMMVVLGGRALTIEYREGGESQPVQVVPGRVGWDEPPSRQPGRQKAQLI